MKKILLSIFLLAACVNIFAEEAKTPAWFEKLRQCEIIDSMLEAHDESTTDSNLTIYHIYYHQPVCHAEPQDEKFQLRALLVVRNDGDQTTCPNLIYFTGYDINSFWNYGVKAYSCYLAEIARRYNGNLLLPEHRYYTNSAPEECWTKLSYCNANEASQDFHALISAVRGVLKGKCAMTGISKGGMTTAIQYAYFPDDADIYIPNSAPFCKGIDDPRVHEFMETNTWNETLREKYSKFIRNLVEDDKAVKMYVDNNVGVYKALGGNVSDSIFRKRYYYTAFNLEFKAHTNLSRDSALKVIEKNEQMKADILSQIDPSKITGDEESRLNYLYIQTSKLDASTAWWSYLGNSSKVKGLKKDSVQIIPESTWKRYSDTEYKYQAALELGQYDYDFHCLYKEEEKQHLADSLQQVYSSLGPYIYMTYPFLKNVKYDDYALFSMVEKRTAEATKPILLLYGSDDPWGGAAMRDEFINGDNVRKYFFDAQTHGVEINLEKTYQDEVWKFIDNVMLDQTGIAAINRNASTKCSKRVENGTIVIMNNGHKYNIAGNMIQ